MDTRLTQWLKELHNADMTNQEIIESLDNGELDAPDWLIFSPESTTAMHLSDEDDTQDAGLIIYS